METICQVSACLVAYEATVCFFELKNATPTASKGHDPSKKAPSLALAPAVKAVAPAGQDSSKKASALALASAKLPAPKPAPATEGFVPAQSAHVSVISSTVGEVKKLFDGVIIFRLSNDHRIYFG